MKKVVNYSIQGDLNFRRIKALPKVECEEIKFDKTTGGYTLATGEATNHKHVLIPDGEEVTIKLLKELSGTRQFIEIKGGNARLMHGTFIAHLT